MLVTLKVLKKVKGISLAQPVKRQLTHPIIDEYKNKMKR